VFATELARLFDYLLNRLGHQIARAAHLQQICRFSFLADRRGPPAEGAATNGRPAARLQQNAALAADAASARA
jgi:hypothetical protein